MRADSQARARYNQTAVESDGLTAPLDAILASLINFLTAPVAWKSAFSQMCAAASST